MGGNWDRPFMHTHTHTQSQNWRRLLRRYNL